MTSKARVVGVLLVVVAGFVPRLLLRPLLVTNDAMRPTIARGDHLIVRRASTSAAVAGDVVVFTAPPWVPRDAGEDWLKRIIAVAGQRVRRSDRTFIVDDKPLALGTKHDDSYLPDGGAELTRVMRRSESVGAPKGNRVRSNTDSSARRASAP